MTATETLIQFFGIAAICFAIVIAIALFVCALIDFTQKTEHPVGSLADEEHGHVSDGEEGGRQ